MNRKDRRALPTQGHGAAVPAGLSAPAAAAAPVLAEASRYQQQGKLQEASRLYKRALAIHPGDAQAHNNLACILLATGKLDEASARFARSLELTPELFELYPDIVAMLVQVNPPIGEAMARAANAWPRLLSAEDLLGPSGIAVISSDAMLRCLLEQATIRDLGLERVLTSIRAALLKAATNADASGRVEENYLRFCCALARQCFINDYVFTSAPEELKQAEQLKASLARALSSRGAVSPLWPAAVAMYFPLGSLPDAHLLTAQKWPVPLDDVVTQQVREPREEQQDQDSILRLTPIENEVSRLVRQQYEENPYPRWVAAASRQAPVAVIAYLRNEFPLVPFQAPDTGNVIEILVAGCGTGRHAIELAQRFKNVHLFAIDLSLSSLGYARRKTRALKMDNIEYAQADILQLDRIGRSFDVIDAGGVLHHLADPMAGWRILLSLLRPGGFMRIALYSALARRDVVAARDFITGQGYGSTADDIRRCRQDLLNSPHKTLARYYDFFSTSECRDLLFHVQEHRLTIPEISSFLSGHGLKFIGFQLPPRILHAYRDRFPDDRIMTNLDHWQQFETGQPDTFAGMYQFWVQKD